MSTGAKRNKLLSIADGAYVMFIDDDDMVSPDYIETLYPVLKPYAYDLVTFDVHYTDTEGEDYICKYDDGARNPAHIHAWKRELIQAPFPDVKAGEDMSWVKKNLPYVTTRYNIDKVLYDYKFNALKTETQRWN
jgi:glycosyltransferase involved in cell wall biosynthesis